MNNKAIVIYSGGVDSTTLLYHVRRESFDLLALSFDYGQKHKRELESAKVVTSHLGIDHRIIDIKSIMGLFSDSALVSPEIEIPEGEYTPESLRSTIVPNRNMIMLSIAAAFAIGEKINHLFYGAHAGDHEVYPDCRPEFVKALAEALQLCDWSPVMLQAPFVRMTKTQIVEHGAIELGVPYVYTYSCYKGGRYHCGKCSTCVERQRAFKEAGVNDPTIYRREE